MFKFIAIVAICYFSTAESSAVHPLISVSKQDGALGVVIPHQDECGPCNTDQTCIIPPGEYFPCEKLFTASATVSSLTMTVEVCFGTDEEYCVQLLDSVIDGSAIEEGVSYNIRFSVVASDIISGKEVQFRGRILHTETEFMEVCVAINCTIL